MKKVIAWIVILLLAAGLVFGAVKLIKKKTDGSGDKMAAVSSAVTAGETELPAPESGEEAAEEKAATVSLPREQVLIDKRYTADQAFEAGNECYQEKEYSEAEAWYELAQRKQKDLDKYELWEVKNNLGLVKLQFQDNKEAFDIFCSILKLDSDGKNDLLPKDDTGKYGVMMNLLAAAHGCGIPARDALTALGEETEPGDAEGKLGLDIVELKMSVHDDPGKYSKLYSGITYNAIYMDIELDSEERRKHVFPYSEEGYLTEAKEMILRDYYHGGSHFINRSLDMLQDIQKSNEYYFGEKDPDIEDLTDYILMMEKEE